ncbi:glucose import [Tritrichomonas musculus]|uniref:Glucose import n=1 Tax=Tritrichomonas musculus TaxID=1915356 RepID=A0ABR2K692_9EUKA
MSGICSIALWHAFVIMLGSMINGNVGIYTSPTADDIRIKHGISLTGADFRWSFYGSIAFLAAALGPFATKFLLNKFQGKRKNTMFVIACFSAVSWAFNCVTKVNIYAGWASRAFLGIAIGSYSSICAMYLVELAPEGTSGFFGSLNQIGIVIGQGLWSFLGPFIDYMGFNYFGIAVSVLQAVLIWFIPESPDAGVGQDEEAPKVSVFQKKYVKNLMIGIVMMFMQQFCGINGILTNLSDIFKDAGLDLNPNYQSGISILSQFVAVFIGSMLMDKLGRKVVWLLSSGICCAGCLIMALNEKFHWSVVLPLICIFVYQLGFGLGLGPIPWFIVSELFEADVRPAANTVCVVSNWVFAFVIVMVFPEMKESMKMFGSMIFFFIVCVLSILFGIFVVKEPSKEVSEDAISEQDNDQSSDSKPTSL